MSGFLFLYMITVCTVRSQPVGTIDIGDAFSHIINQTIYQTVNGQITVEPHNMVDYMLSDVGYGFAIQDATAGIWVYINDEEFYDDSDKLSEMVLGRWVTVTGNINTATGATERDRGGLLRITPTSFDDVVLGDLGDPVEPIIIEPDEVATTQGLLVKIEDVTCTLEIVSNEWGADYRIKDDSNKTTSVWFYPSSEDRIEVGVEYDHIIGFSGIFIKINLSHVLEEEWEIWPRGSMDWKEVTTTTSTVTPTTSIAESLYFFINICIALAFTLLN